MRVTTDAVQLLGGAGYTRDFPLERMMRRMHEVHGTRCPDHVDLMPALELPLQGVRDFVVEWSRR